MINTKEDVQMIYDDFCHHNPGLVTDVVDWYPSGHLEITVKLDNGSKVFYSYLTKTLREMFDSDYCTEQKFKDAFSWQLFSRIRAIGLTNAEVADRAGITPAQLSGYITGRTIPNSYTVYKLANVLQCNPSELLWVK